MHDVTPHMYDVTPHMQIFGELGRVEVLREEFESRAQERALIGWTGALCLHAYFV